MDCVEGKRKSDFCQLCSEENKSSKADGLCRECQELMCQTCFQHHLKARVCRTHVLLDPRDTNISSTTDKDIEKCGKHVNETVRFYCRKHDQIGCGDCMLFDGHGSCQPEFIDDVSSNFRRSEELKRLTNKLQTLESDNNDVIKKVQNNVESNRKMNDVLVADVKSFRKRIDDYFDKAEAENLTFIEKKCSQYSNSLKQLETECNVISSELGEHKQKLNDACNTDRALFIHSVVAKSKLQQLESSIKQSNSSSEVDSFEFKPDKQLSEVLSKFNSLGRFEKVSNWDAACPECEPLPTAQGDRIAKAKSEANYIQTTESSMTNQNIEAGFQSMHGGPVRPCPRPLATASSTGGPGGPQMRRSTLNVRPITGQSIAPARPRMTMPQSNMPGRPQNSDAQTIPQGVRPGFNQFQNTRPQRRSHAIVVSGQEALTVSMLAAAPPQEQKKMIGERLFPLVQRLYPDVAGKITGMLLTITNSELLQMLESTETLKDKVEEAFAVLQAYHAKEAAANQAAIRDIKKDY